MSTLYEKISEDLITAKKEKETIKKNVLIMLKSAIGNQVIELKRELSDIEVTEIVSRTLKQTKDAQKDFEKGGRQDLVDQAVIEATYLEKYLPTQLSETEITNIITEIMIEYKITKQSQKGLLMKHLMPKVKGLADGSLVNAIVTNILGGLDQ